MAQINLESESDVEAASQTDASQREPSHSFVAMAPVAQRLSQDPFEPLQAQAPRRVPAQLDRVTQELLDRNKRALEELQRSAKEGLIDLVATSEGAPEPTCSICPPVAYLFPQPPLGT